jgi:S1-C subfamily serine protease
VKLGEKVFTLGFPKVSIQGEEPKFTEGSISGLYGFQDDSGQFQISVPIQPGNSGGALVNAAGQVVGIIVSKLPSGQNVNFAVKSNRARLLFDDVPEIQFTTTEPGVPLTQEQVAERLVNSTVLLLIY